MDRQAPRKAIIVPIEKGRLRRPKPVPVVEQRPARKKLNPLAIVLVGLIALCALALAIKATLGRWAATDSLAAATGTGLAIVVGLASVAALAYVRRGDFARRVRPGSGPPRRGPRSGAFHS